MGRGSPHWRLHKQIYYTIYSQCSRILLKAVHRSLLHTWRQIHELFYSCIWKNQFNQTSCWLTELLDLWPFSRFCMKILATDVPKGSAYFLISSCIMYYNYNSISGFTPDKTEKRPNRHNMCRGVRCPPSSVCFSLHVWAKHWTLSSQTFLTQLLQT